MPSPTAYRHVRLALLQRPILDVQQRRAIAHSRHLGCRIHRAEIGGPVRIHLELHVRTLLGDDVVAEPTIDLGELPPVVVQKQRNAVRTEALGEAVDGIHRAFDGVHGLEVVWTEAAGGAVQAKSAHRIHHFAE